MARRTSTLLDDQPSLWDGPAPEPVSPAPKAPSKPKRQSGRNHVLGMPWPWRGHPLCIPTCLACRKPDGMGTCEYGCAVVCGRPTPLDRDKGKAPVEVCLATLVLQARLIGGRAVVLCPHCDGTHWHQPTPGRRYRVGQCGQPYIVHTPTI